MANNINTKRVGWANLFPCAVGVHAPKIGVDTASKVKDPLAKDHNDFVPPVTIFPQDSNPANEHYVKMLSSDIRFSEDVVEDRCLFMMPYSNKYFEDIFKPGELLSHRPLSRSKSNLRLSISSRQTSKMHCLPPLQQNVKDKAIQMHKQALDSTLYKKSDDDNDENCASYDSFFITACPSDNINKHGPKNMNRDSKGITSKGKINENKAKRLINTNISSQTGQNINNSSSSDWDDYLLSGLSQLTANWIVHKCIPSNKQKEKLSKLLESWYGPPNHTDLVREELSDGEEDADKTEKPKKKWIKKETLLLSAVDDLTPTMNEATDPYSDENKAPFYRQPIGIRNKMKAEIKEEAGLINATAQIVTKELKEPKPVTLKDLLSPRVGDKVYDTDNLFQQEWLTGKKQVCTPGGYTNVIVMETEHKFQKHLQPEVPEQPEIWFPINKAKVKENFMDLPSIGYKKWTALPDIIDESAGILIDPFAETEPKPVSTFVPEEKSNIKQNSSLLSIAHTWRSQWFLSGQYADSTPDDLIRDMMDIQPHVRIKAISTLAKAAEMMSQTKARDHLENEDSSFDLPKKLFVALECLLDDSHEQMRKAAAIALYSFNRPTEKSKERLKEMLYGKVPVDRWAAAQCLAHYGETDSDVVAEILKQIMTNEDQNKFEQGAHLLAKLSNQSTLVHCMVAEQLNSNSWRHRVMACKLLPTLYGTINRDITQKLSDLMWHDWHEEVRKAAAQCLGKAGQGRDVHDNIRHQLMTGTERIKVEALNKIGQLGLMTGKLLPAFLECFAEPYVSIRAEVCRTCANLKIKEPQTIDRLVHLASFDPIWQVKAFAIQALGKIGELNEDIKETLLWALRYEDQAGVRAEACHSLMLLDARNEEVILALQERLLVESNEMVREQMKLALTRFGVSISEDMDTVKQIKAEIVKLCTRNVIASQILINEQDQSKQEHLAEMVCQSEQDKQTLIEKRDNQLRLIRSRVQGTPPSSHPTTPRLRVKSAEGCTSPEQMSQDGTAFTPTGDRELEALISLDGAESYLYSASRSRPVTRDSEKSYVDSAMDQYLDHTEGSSRYENDPTGSVHVQNVLQEHGSKSKSRRIDQNISSLRAVTPSARDIELSRLTHSGYFERKSILSREALKERQLMDKEADTIYYDLETRYMEMVSELMEADRGLNMVPDEGTKTAPQQPMMTNNGVKTDEIKTEVSKDDGGTKEINNDVTDIGKEEDVDITDLSSDAERVENINRDIEEVTDLMKDEELVTDANDGVEEATDVRKVEEKVTDFKKDNDSTIDNATHSPSFTPRKSDSDAYMLNEMSNDFTENKAIIRVSSDDNQLNGTKDADVS
ncbi:hypothetical protein Btru_056480 [Bulinus truncatus]|nr:hypothetical protein Btru_056480 [Bulinus truncatus]